MIKKENRAEYPLHKWGYYPRSKCNKLSWKFKPKHDSTLAVVIHFGSISDNSERIHDYP